MMSHNASLVNHAPLPPPPFCRIAMSAQCSILHTVPITQNLLLLSFLNGMFHKCTVLFCSSDPPGCWLVDLLGQMRCQASSVREWMSGKGRTHSSPLPPDMLSTLNPCTDWIEKVWLDKARKRGSLSPISYLSWAPKCIHFHLGWPFVQPLGILQPAPSFDTIRVKISTLFTLFFLLLSGSHPVTCFGTWSHLHTW